MKTGLIAMQEIRVGLRNRWVLATTLLLAALALSLVLLGSAPTGTVKADPLAVVIVSLSSLTIFLVPLIALLISHNAITREAEGGTLLLLLSHPLARWQRAERLKCQFSVGPAFPLFPAVQRLFRLWTRARKICVQDACCPNSIR